MENSTNNIVTPNQVKTEKKHNKYLPVMIILAVLAVGGIGFGIFGMVKNGQANVKAGDLATELDQKNEALKQAEEKLGAQVEIKEEKIEDNGSKEENAIATVNVSAARDYIYVGEWGIKIKIPENLTVESFKFDNLNNVLWINGATANDKSSMAPTFLYNAIASTSGMGVIAKYHKSNAVPDSIKVGGVAVNIYDDNYVYGDVVYVDDEFFYVYEHPQALYTTEKSEEQWEVESVNAIADMIKTGVSAF